jgi:hypothetical protein
MRKLLLALLALPILAFGQEFTPVQGHYYDPDQPGTGYLITVQNQAMVVAVYSYTVDGDPIWYLVECFLNSKALSCSGNLQKYANGQSIGGSYVAPEHDGNDGKAKFTWLSEAKLEVLLPQGRVATIVPLEYKRYNGAAAMLGKWVFVAFNAAGVTKSTPVLNFIQINKDNDEVYAPDQRATCKLLPLGVFGCKILDVSGLPTAVWIVRIFFNDARGFSGNVLDGDVVVQGYRLDPQSNAAP